MRIKRKRNTPKKKIYRTKNVKKKEKEVIIPYYG